MPRLLTPTEVDRWLAWPLGRSERLAKRGKLPHVVLPDGAVRFRRSDVAKMPKPRPAEGGAA